MTPETPHIIIDNREQMPLTFQHFPSRRGTLQSGDYSLARFETRFTVERKSIDDLIGSLTAGRFYWPEKLLFHFSEGGTFSEWENGGAKVVQFF